MTMLLAAIRRIPEFHVATPAELRALVTHAVVLQWPAQRWLIRPGQTLPDYFYLLDGRLQIHQPDRVIRPRRHKPLKHFYPGCVGVFSRSDSTLLRIDADHRDLVIRQHMATYAVDSGQTWVSRFLDSHMMQQLNPLDWQRLLQSAEDVWFAPGKRVIGAGQPAQHCFVVVDGVAEVRSATQRLDMLRAGDFFGEDALVLNTTRTADVVAHSTLHLKRIAADVFIDMLLMKLLPRVAQPDAAATQVNAAACNGQYRQFMQQLPEAAAYCVVGGQPAQRAMLTLLLLQAGKHAHMLA